MLNHTDLKAYKIELNKKTLFFLLMSLKMLFTFKPQKFLVYLRRAKGLMTAKFSNKYPKDIEKAKIVVYTVLYGNSDVIKPIAIKNSNIDYFAYTDQVVPSDSGWIKKEYDFPKKLNNDNILKSRYLRMHPHMLFPDYDYAIYLDSSFIIKHDLFYLLGRIGTNNIAMFAHPWAKDIYDEANLVIHWKRDSEEKTLNQIQRYKKEGYPKNFGMTTTGIIVSKCNNCHVINLMEAWWDEYSKPENTKRDQMCLFYVLWKMGFKIDFIKPLGIRVYDDPIVEWKR